MSFGWLWFFLLHTYRQQDLVVRSCVWVGVGGGRMIVWVHVV